MNYVMRLVEVTLKPLCSVFITAVLLCGCSDTGKKQAPPKPKPVSVLNISPKPILLTTELSGRVTAYSKAEVRPQVGGIILERLFTEGSEVQKGQSLYLIDPEPYRAALDKARGELKRALAKLEYSELKLKRYSELGRINAVSRQDIEDIQSEHRQSKAETEICRANLRSARINLEYTEVKAPIAGHIGKSSFTQGALLTTNQEQPLAVIQNIDPVYVDIPQSSIELSELRERLESGHLSRTEATRADVRLILENGRKYPIIGVLQCTDITVDESTGMVSLRAVFPNPDRKLLPGMYVRAVIQNGIDKNAFLLPRRALMRNAKGEASVFIVNEAGLAEQRFVTATETGSAFWNIEQGLTSGDRVVIEGYQNLRPDTPVTVTAELTTDDLSQ